MFSAPGEGHGLALASRADRSRCLLLIPTDVGVGIAKDTKPNTLSNVSLRWMVREVMKADCGVLFDLAALGQWNIPLPETRPSIALSPPGKAAVPNDGPAPSEHVEYEELEFWREKNKQGNTFLYGLPLCH